MAVPKRKRSKSIIRIRHHQQKLEKKVDISALSSRLTYCWYCKSWKENILCHRTDCIERYNEVCVQLKELI